MTFSDLAEPADRQELGVPPDIEAFVRAERDSLVGLAYVLTGSREQAEYAVQEVTARLLGRDTTTVADMGSYARRVLVNECQSWRRTLARRDRRAVALEAESLRIERTQPDLFTRTEVMSALERLTRRQRVVVVLKYLLDLDESAIADRLGCAPAPVRSLSSRAIRKLRAELEGESMEGNVRR